MSLKAVIWAKTWRIELSSPQLFVFLTIADYYNDEKHRAYPSMATVASDTRLHRATVDRCVTRLAELGLVEVEPWINASSGKQMANRYCLPLYDSASVRASTLPVRVSWQRDLWITQDA